jgi:hypothetical protein
MMDKRMMKQAQQLQAKMLKTQEELGNETVEGSAGGGAVLVTLNGHQDIQSITISKEVVDPDDVELLQDMILAALNDGMGKAKELASSRLGALTGGLNIPGLM